MTTTYPMLPFTSIDDMLEALDGIARIDAGGGPAQAVEILDAAGLRDGLIDRLIATAVFAEGPERDAARWLIRVAAPALGAWPGSIHPSTWPPAAASTPTAPLRPSTCADSPTTPCAPSTAPRAPTTARSCSSSWPAPRCPTPSSDRRVRQQRAGGRDQGGASGAGLHPGRPLPDQRQELGQRLRSELDALRDLTARRSPPATSTSTSMPRPSSTSPCRRWPSSSSSTRT